MDNYLASKTVLSAHIDGIELRAAAYGPIARAKADLFCLPGGGSSAAYFDLAPGFSFVEKMTQAGYRVITMDHPGTAVNPLPQGHDFLTPRQSASYIARALKAWRGSAPLVGIGHSMGGMMATLVQAQSGIFSGLALLGSSAGGLEWGLTEAEKDYIEKPDEFARDQKVLTLGKFKTPFPNSTGGPSGKSITFGGETEALTEKLRGVTCELFAAGGMMSMTRGSFRREVEAIDVPIFFAFGDHDIGIAPQDAPKDYINAKGTQLVILKATGHNHFAFSSIHTLCRELDHWASSFI